MVVTRSQQLWWHVGDGAIGTNIHGLIAQLPAQPEVSHLGRETALICRAVAQQDIATRKVTVQQVPAV